MLAVSGALHVVAGGALALAPASFDRMPLAGAHIVEVKMVTLAPTRPREAAPAPRPAPPPPPPKEERVVIPERVRAIEPEPPKPKPPRQQPAPEPEPEIDYGDALEALRDELGEPDPAAEPEPDDDAVAPVAGSATGRTVAPEVARWVSRVKRRVRGAWVLAPGFHTQTLQTDVEVFLGRDGEVKGVEILRRSGNPWYDQSVERALYRASPLPPPPEPGSWPFSFSPEDAR